MVLAAIPDPSLQRQLELEAVESNVVLRLPDEILLHYEDAAVSSPQGPARIAALTNLGLARRRCGRTDDAAASLREARRHASALPKGPDRASALLGLVNPLTDLTLLDDAESTLKEAASAIAALPESSRFAFLVPLADAQFDQADPEAAAATAAAAVNLAPTGSPADRQRLATFFIRTGNWPSAMQIVSALPPDHVGDALRESLTVAAEDSLGYDPMAPPARGEPVDSIRKMAAGDENRVISLVERQAPGYPRARAWLAMAKGLLTGHPQDSLPPLQPPLPDDALPPPEGSPEPPPAPLAPVGP
jgi:tetratricopeptide (TPR) repeat protein